MPQFNQRGLASPANVWSVATVVLMLGPWSTFGADDPPATVGTCPPNQLQKILLTEGLSVSAPSGFDALAFYDTATGKSIRDLFPLLKNNTWIINDDDLTFPNTPYKDKISLAWTQRAGGEKSPLCLQPIEVPANTVVTAVTCGTDQTSCSAGLGGQIWIRVQDLDSWTKDHAVVQGRPTPQTVGDLVPFFDGVPVRGIHPENPGAQPDGLAYNFRSYHTLRFTLERNESNRGVWNRFLRGLKWDGRKLDVSVGFEGGDSMPSWVQKDRPSSSDPNYRQFKTFTLVVLPHFSTVVAALLFSVALLAFFWLVKATEILQDVSAPLRPYGQSPYSLARVQMAFWFFLVVAAWFLLFLVTKDIDTLTGSVLVLMGISAGTAVGSAIMDAGTTIDAAERIRNVPADPDGVGQRVRELRDKVASTRTRVAASDAERDATREELRRYAAELALAESQQTFFRRRSWLRVTYDLLGDEGHISFHRFQVAVWTLVLGLVFVVRVLSELAMPEFSATVLGLMGISSGTYLGFKLNAASAAGAEGKN